MSPPVLTSASNKRGFFALHRKPFRYRDAFVIEMDRARRNVAGVNRCSDLHLKLAGPAFEAILGQE
jgi:hypothetical protein